MIFGRGKKPENSETQAVTTAAAEAPVAMPPPVTPALASTLAVPATAPEKMDSNPTPATETPVQAGLDEKELRARRAMGAKMVVASFGEIVTILMRSNTYKHFSLSDLEWLVIPPVLAQQFILAEARKGDEDIATPIAVALWASVSQEVDQKLSANITGPLRLRPDEWKSGEILWLIDAVGPSQILKDIIDNLHKNVFKGRPLKVRGRDQDGKPIIKIQKLPVAEGEAVS